MATEEEKTLDNNESEGMHNDNEQHSGQRPRYTRPADGTRVQRPRFSREGGAPRYQRVEQRPQRPYQSRYGQDNENEGRPRYNADYRSGYGENRPRYNQGEQRPYRSSEQRPYNREQYSYSDRAYSSESRQYSSEQREDRPSQPRYNRDDQQRPYNRPQRPYQPRYNDRDSYGDRPQRPYQPRYEQGNAWENRDEEGMRPQRRSYGGNGEGNGYRQNAYGANRPQGGYGNRPQKRRPTAAPAKKYNKKQIQYREEFADPSEELRLNKYLANAGVCSRREADEFITAGVVSVNGVIVTELGTKVKRGDEVRFHDQPVSIERKIYLLLNKPKDYVTTVEDPQDRKTVMELVRGACKERIYPVGRLDRNTTGVLLFTNDGEMASRLTHPSFMKKKVYHVRLDKAITPAEISQLLEGVQLEDGEIRCDAASYTVTDTDHTQLGIEIHSGRNRVVRRMFEAIGYHVVRLDRTQFAGLTKKNLRRGDWRFLTEREVNMLRMGSYE